MGTFADFYCPGKLEIQNKEEFIEKVEKVFQYGGMMEIERVGLCGKEVTLLRKATMDSEGMDFHYNYFEDKKKYNKGRITLRRYMALLGNKLLREKVLGF